MKKILTSALIMLFSSAACYGITPAEAKAKLIEGNQRFMQGKAIHCDHSQDLRASLVEGQAPYATIVACSDSRVSPEIVFDAGLGELFIVRVAGNAIEELETDSVSYAVNILHSPLIVVVGHENCGALKAVIAGKANDFPELKAAIAPRVLEISADAPGALKEAILANVRFQVEELRNHPAFKAQIANKKLDVVGGYYSLQTGKVEFLPQ